MITKEEMVKRWSDPTSRPLFKGKLIDKNAPPGEIPCCCAQGDVLRCSGVTDDELVNMSQKIADLRVAKLLGITIFESILLRSVNDSEAGCPQAVFTNPAQILGKHSNLILAFWKHIDGMAASDLDAICIAILRAKFHDSDLFFTESTATYTSSLTAKNHVIDTTSSWYGTIMHASLELQGWSQLMNKPRFLPFFFRDCIAWVKSIDPSAVGGWEQI